jgi:CheY-like chemotaxis protein
MDATIFVVDHSPAVHHMVQHISAPEGYRVIGFQDGPTALEAARKLAPALVIADFHLENITFSGFCKAIGKQDSLAETLIVPIIDASDNLDESKLRALGIQAFLKKPFQSEQLLDTITSILNDQATTRQRNEKLTRTRTWPPASTATDDEGDGSLRDTSTADDAVASTETEKELIPMSPLPQKAAASALPSAAPSPVGSTGEEVMKGFFDHLLQSVTRQADRNLSDLLPPAIAKEVAGQVNLAVRAAVQEEVAKQLTEVLIPEGLQDNIRELIREELNRQTSAHLASVETAVGQAVSELAPPLVKQSVELLLGDVTETGMKKHLPEALKEHLETIRLLVKNEAEQVAASSARQAADDIVREMAQDPIQQAIRRIVPDVADIQIRAEIKRLSSLD